MPLSNRDRIQRGLELLKEGIIPYAEKRFQTYTAKTGFSKFRRFREIL
jgi:hypothetical protein